MKQRKETNLGLSTYERYSNIAHIISDITKLKFTSYGYENLNPLIGKLWFAFLGNTSNSLHWLFGSASSSYCLKEQNLLTVAFNSIKNQKIKEKDEDEAPKKFNAFEWYIEFKPVAESTLDTEEKDIWKLYQLCESYFYYCNRYDDEFTNHMKATTEVITNIAGLLFNIFKDDPNFNIAWMMGNILSKIFIYSENDIVLEAGFKFHLQHDLKVKWQNYQKIYKMFSKYQKTKGSLSAEKRLSDLLLLTNGRFYYEYKYEQLYDMINNWNNEVQLISDLYYQKLTKEEIALEINKNIYYVEQRINNFINLEKIKKLCKKNIQIHKKEQNWNNNYKFYCYFTNQEI